MTEAGLRKMWINKRVIAISNGFETNPKDKSLSLGTIIDLVPISQSKTLTPLVQYDDEPEPFISFASLMEFSHELWETLNKLTARERWELFQSFCYRYQAR